MHLADMAATLAASAVTAGVSIVLALRLGSGATPGRAGEADVNFAVAWAALGLAAIAQVAGAAGAIAAGASDPVRPPVVAEHLLFIVYAAAASLLVVAFTALGGLERRHGYGLAGLTLAGNVVLQSAQGLGWIPGDPGHLAAALLLPVVGAAWSAWRHDQAGADPALSVRTRTATLAFGIWALGGVGLILPDGSLPAVFEPATRLAAVFVFTAVHPIGVVNPEAVPGRAAGVGTLWQGP